MLWIAGPNELRQTCELKKATAAATLETKLEAAHVIGLARDRRSSRNLGKVAATEESSCSFEVCFHRRRRRRRRRSSFQLPKLRDARVRLF